MKKIIFILFLIPCFCNGQSFYLRNKEIMDSIRAWSDSVKARPTIAQITSKTVNYLRNDTVFAATINAPGDTVLVARYKLPAASWAGVTGKPSTYTPATHSHTESEVTNLVNDLAGKQATITVGSIANDRLANGAVANLSGTNTGDNAANSTYANDYRAANFVAGTNYLAPNGSAASLINFPTLNQNTSGTAAGLSAVLTFDKGGIGSGAATSATTGTISVSMVTEMISCTPSSAMTLNATGGVTGQRVTFIFTTSGVSSFVITFGTNFKAASTLATGTTTAKKFCVSFIYDGSLWLETSRTAAM